MKANILKKSALFGVIVMGLISGSVVASNIFGKAKIVDAKDVIEQVEKYIGKFVETEGKIIHVCGVDRKKIRLFVENVGSINIIPENPNTTFDYDLNQKEVVIVGIVKEIRIEKNRIDEMEQNLALLCSIDKEPCIDPDYVERRRRNGTLETDSKRHINGLRETMEKTGKDYISIVTIVAKSVEIK
ncbi:MAG: hypothetical protein LBH22_09825 [Bacteroidales bacterium]|jgi:2,4-dienoyl-CoA reductase-like NADH-dependent reductase (Old Yellow Enzyme family)|nr:hypothetical protein [Bacteroidales bacterium]